MWTRWPPNGRANVGDPKAKNIPYLSAVNGPEEAEGLALLSTGSDPPRLSIPGQHTPQVPRGGGSRGRPSRANTVRFVRVGVQLRTTAGNV